MSAAPIAVSAQAPNPIKDSKKVAEMSMSLSQQQQTGSSATQIKKTATEAKKDISLGLGLEYSQKTAVDEVGARENDFSVTIIPAYKINDTFAIGAKGIISKQNYGPGDTTYSNTTVSLSIKGFDLTENIKSVHSVGGALPTSKESQERDRLKGGVSISNGLSLDTPIVKLKYLLALSRNFHEFTFNAEGSANVEYRIGHSVEGILSLTDIVSLSTTGIYRQGYTYGGKERYSFEIHGDINVDVAKGLTLNVGTSNDGSALKANGVDSNISAFNENTSVVRAGISYAY